MKKWSLRGKIVITGIFLPAVLVIFLMQMYIKESDQRSLAAFSDKARIICLTSESILEEMEEKWDLGLFSMEQLKTLAKNNEINKIFETVPVFTAMSAAMRKADKGGYVFKAPRFNPRNPDNKPDETESRILKIIKNQNLDEYYEVDEKINAVRYFRPVRLSESCLICHGNSDDSEKLWGNTQGKDITNYPMENWKKGEIQGAFEIIQSLDESDRLLAESVKKALAVVIISLILIALFFATLAIRILSHSVTMPIRRIIDKVSSASFILSEEAKNVAKSSEELADGAMSQASSIEQSATALEQVTAMTKSTALNVKKTSQVAREVLASVDTAKVSMERMLDVIASIKKSSDQTVSIVKNIDEIAFQTNLLSLNASIEAARAGETGAGFAIVAEEVRSLAMRSASAAKETTELIKQSQKNSESGVTAAKEVKDILKKIIDLVNNVNTLAQEISIASSEQAEGVKQVNIGVSEIGSVTQANTDVSEEVALASRELSKQADNLNNMVKTLAGIL
ncbi:methyl-accepting chemotaxis protein [Desulfonema limicola]|nr:methyl-accepting chemotaxis protein [Desulfonema limicola]